MQRYTFAWVVVDMRKDFLACERSAHGRAASKHLHAPLA
jgi:hypothetical protein